MVVGNHNTVTGDSNNVTGNHNTVTGNHNTVTGNHNNVHGQVGNEVLGRYNRLNGVEVPAPEGSEGVTINSFCGLGGSGGGVRMIRGSRGNMIIQHANGGITSIGSVGDGGTISMSSISAAKSAKSVKGGKGKKEVSKKREREEPAEPVFIECPTEAEMKEHDKEAEEGASACAICISNVPVCAVVPCMHKCLCCACARTLAGEGTKAQGEVACPLCKEKVEKIKKVYE